MEKSPPASYWLTRFVILRLLGLVYLVAFLVAANQNGPLIGSHGLTPADTYMQAVLGQSGTRWEAFCRLPTLFWLGISDTTLSTVAWLGVGLSALLLAGYANSILMVVLWALYMSIVHVGQDWYGFGWEIQLLETGFLGIFLCPLWDMRPFPRTAPPIVVLWLFRWLGFRIMLGSGLIKLRGDSCWHDLTCLDYHFETQPNPNPLSRYLHYLPHPILHFGVLWNHVVELVAPWFSFGPRTARHAAGIVMISFQLFLIISGNLSFLNWLTIVPFLACLDDSLWQRCLPRRLVEKARQAAVDSTDSVAQRRTSWVLAALIACLSLDPVRNLISSDQAMNTSFNPLELVNTYGAFGSVGQERNEIILEGTTDTTVTSSTVWREYEFRCKPGNPYRRPCIITPYHERLDWLMWFAAMADPDQYPWIYHLVWKLLHNDPGALSLLGSNPFPDGPPHVIRATLYRYRFAPPGDPRWWIRERLRPWLPELSLDNSAFRAAARDNGWLP